MRKVCVPSYGLVNYGGAAGSFAHAYLPAWQPTTVILVAAPDLVCEDQKNRARAARRQQTSVGARAPVHRRVSATALATGHEAGPAVAPSLQPRPPTLPSRPGLKAWPWPRRGFYCRLLPSS